MSRKRRVPSFRLPLRRWQAVALTVAVASLAALHQWRPEWFPSPSSHPATQEVFDAKFARVAFVIDGDTFALVEGNERVRLQGVDTPETVKKHWPVEPWGLEASQFTKNFLAGGQVRLEFDVERRDKYGRLLAYAWVGDRMLNEELLRAGLAHAEMQYRYSAAMKERFRSAEAEAKSARRGIWSIDDSRRTP